MRRLGMKFIVRSVAFPDFSPFWPWNFYSSLAIMTYFLLWCCTLSWPEGLCAHMILRAVSEAANNRGAAAGFRT